MAPRGKLAQGPPRAELPWHRRAPQVLSALPLTAPIYTLLGEQRCLASVREKQIILPAVPVFTQTPLVYEEQLSQSTQRNTLQFYFFFKRVGFCFVVFFFFIASRSKRLATEIERTKQCNKQLLLVFLILPKPCSHSSCSSHPGHSRAHKEHPEPPKTLS